MVLEAPPPYRPLNGKRRTRRLGKAPIGALALLLAISPLAAAITYESEPNNSPDEANPVALGDERGGNCDDGPDVTAVDLEANKTYRIEYNTPVINGNSNPLRLYDPSKEIFREVGLANHGNVSFVALAAGTHYFNITCSFNAGSWELTWTDEGPSAGIAGPDETEHNDMMARATELSGAGRFEGAGAALSDPVDYWHLPLAAGQSARVRVANGTGLTAGVARVDQATGAVETAGSQIELNNPGAAGYTFAVSSSGGQGAYNLTVEVVADLSVFYAGPDEQEPNNDVANATPIRSGTTATLSGELGGWDRYDVFSVNTTEALRVTATLTYDLGCSYSCPEVRVVDANGTTIKDPNGHLLVGKNVTFPAASASRLLFEVDGSSWSGGHYTLALKLTPSPYAQNATVDVALANASHAITVLMTAPYQEHVLHSVNLALGGYGTMYGRCIWTFVDNFEPVPLKVRFPAGQLLVPDDSDVERYVITRDQIVQVPAGGSVNVTLVAAMVSSGGKVAGFLVFFDLGTMATGSLANVTRETANGDYSEKAEIVAIWGGVNGMSSPDLRSWGADQGSINEAGQILLHAGVQSSITAAPPGPQPTGSPGQNAAAPGANVPLIVGVVFVGLLVVGAAARAAARRNRQARFPPMPPPAAGPAEPGRVPSSPGYFRYGGAPPPAGPQVPMAPPAVPLMTAVQAPAATPPSTAGPSDGMSTCPQCAAPIAVGAPKCAACGLDIAWN